MYAFRFYISWDAMWDTYCQCFNTEEYNSADFNLNVCCLYFLKDFPKTCVCVTELSTNIQNVMLHDFCFLPACYCLLK